MKKIFTLLTIVITASSTLLPQQLRKVVTRTLPYATSEIFFLNETTGWCSGYSESIYKTTDAGSTWAITHEAQGSSRTVSAVQFINENMGYAAGGNSSDSLFLKTTDGGITWTELQVPWNYSGVALSFIDASTGWVLASSSSSADIWKTTDGGLNWVNVLVHTTGDLEDIEVRSSGKGVAVGGGVGKLDIYYTPDGTTWTKAPAPSLGGFTYTRTDVHSVDMVDDNLIYTSGWGSYVGAQPSIFLKSTDGGATWTYLTQLPENRIYANMNAIYFKDENNGVAFGGGAYEGTICARTTNGGVDWIPLPTGSGFTANSCSGLGNKIWVTGGDATIYSSNFGDSFRLLTPVIAASLYEIKTIGNTVYAGGYTGAFFKSTDKGVTWTTHFASIGRISPHINALYFLDEQTGFAARNNHLVCKTTDGGDTWVKLIKDSSATGMSNYGIWFQDINTGYAAGKLANTSDIIYKTTDAGLNWSSVGPIANEDLNDIAFGNANTGVAVGNDFKILYTTDAGANWQLAVIDNLPSTELDIKDVAFATPTNVVAVGEKCILTSANGGANWSYKETSGFTRSLEGVAFKDANEGWAVGYRNIYHTTNGGTDWQDISDTLVTLNNTSLYSAAVDNEGYLWICGGSEIFTYSPFVTVSDENIPSDFSLSQNYPNPFNPLTSIKYRIPAESKVTIRIYDILGNLVKELVNAIKPAGEFNISFDGKGLSSGIYFCRMNAEGKAFTRKMTLLK